MPVTKVIEVIGSSPNGSDDAVREAFEAASRSIRGISRIDIVSVSVVVVTLPFQSLPLRWCSWSGFWSWRRPG